MRETRDVVVPPFDGSRNRDLGKRFRLTEWPAAIAENWLTRLLLAYNRSGAQLPLELSGIGPEGLTILAINTFLRGNIVSSEIVPIWEELLSCVSVVRDPKHHVDVATPFTDDDTEEVATRVWLRLEVLSLHLGFSVTDAMRSLWKRIMAMDPPSSATPTSPPA